MSDLERRVRRLELRAGRRGRSLEQAELAALRVGAALGPPVQLGGRKRAPGVTSDCCPELVPTALRLQLPNGAIATLTAGGSGFAFRWAGGVQFDWPTVYRNYSIINNGSSCRGQDGPAAGTAGMWFGISCARQDQRVVYRLGAAMSTTIFQFGGGGVMQVPRTPIHPGFLDLETGLMPCPDSNHFFNTNTLPLATCAAPTGLFTMTSGGGGNLPFVVGDRFAWYPA